METKNINAWSLFNQPPLALENDFPDKIKPARGELARFPVIPRLVLPNNKKFRTKNMITEIRKLATWKGVFVFYDYQSMPAQYMDLTAMKRCLSAKYEYLAKRVDAIKLYTVRRELKWCFLYRLDIPLPDEEIVNLLNLLRGSPEQKELGRQILQSFISNGD